MVLHPPIVVELDPGVWRERNEKEKDKFCVYKFESLHIGMEYSNSGTRRLKLREMEKLSASLVEDGQCLHSNLSKEEEEEEYPCYHERDVHTLTHTADLYTQTRT